MNMVIHDLRNPTNQINFASKYTLERMLSLADLKSINNQDMYDRLQEIAYEADSIKI